MIRPLAGLTFAIVAWTSSPFAAPPMPMSRCVAAAEHGQQERDRGNLVSSRASFRACAADECPPLVRKDCAQWLSDLETNIPSVVLGAKDARGNDVIGARILVDGESHEGEIASGRAISLDPGPHLFRFEHPPQAPVEVTAVLRTGEHNRPIYGTFAPTAASPGSPATLTSPIAPSSATPPSPVSSPPAAVRTTQVSPWAYALGAVALAGGASFAILGATGESEKNQLRAECGNRCSDSQVAPLKVKYIAADASLGVGVIAALVSTWLFLHPTSRETTSTSTSLTFAPGRGGASVSLVGRF